MNVFQRINGRRDVDVSTEEWELPDELEPASEPSGDGRAVDFPLAFRGYDRAKVDEYMEDVSHVIEQLETARAPDAAVKRELEQIGEQTTAILQRAHEAEENITSRARGEADATLRSAEDEARATRERAEARVRELDEDTELLWQERHHLLEDMQRLFNQVGRVMAAANKRFPPPAVATDPEPVEPDEALALLDTRTVNGDEEEAPAQPEDDEPIAKRGSVGLFGEELDWEDAPEYRFPVRDRGGPDVAWEPGSEEDTAIAAYRVEGPDDEPGDVAPADGETEPPYPSGRTSLLERLLSPRRSDHA